MTIEYSPTFQRSYRKLPSKTRILAEVREEIFREDPFDDRLNTHKLHGRLKGYWSFSVDYKYRIIFEFSGKERVYFHNIGGHDIYE